MTMQRGELPELVRQRAQTLGAEGQRWLAELPERIAAIEREWGIRTGPPLPGGSAAYVALATTAEGAPAVLKLQLPPFAEVARQIAVLRAGDGRGYVRLLRHDAAHGALLQERLGRRLSQVGLPVARQMAIICATLQAAWQAPPPDDVRFPTGAEKARDLRAFILELWQELARPCPEAVITRAVAYTEARERAYDPQRAALLHADAHADNTLARLDHPAVFAFIDPEGLLAERAYDLAIPMREWSAELLAGDALRLGRARCATLSYLTCEPEEPIWQWGFIERVSSGLLLLKLGETHEGAAMLRVADAWLG